MADCAPTLDHTPHGTANQANAKNRTAKRANSDSTIHTVIPRVCFRQIDCFASV